jgi:hypothetical protein
MKSPFKFLDSYTKSDKDIFFGRDREVEELYQKVFESKLLLLYGVSGTGKTSIIQCGLANKFLDSDWLQLNIRRGEDINESFITEVRNELSGSETNTSSLKKAVKDLYLDNFKPIYFIFDQFEELFIFGSDEEREQFVRSIRELLDSDLQCRFVFSIREEYLANLTEFESIIPELFANRVRIERMNIQQAKAVIEGSCSYAGISLESGFAEKLLDNIVTYTKQVELTYLQVYLDRLYNKIIANNLLEHFSLELLNSLDNVKDLLGGFLDDQINQFQDSDIVLTILKSFVSSRGTKKQITIEEVQEFGKSIGKELGQDSLQQIIQSLVEIRILQDKNESNKYELRHDALAAKVYEKISIAEKELIEVRSHVLNAYSNYERRGVLLTKEDLHYIAPYEDKLYLNSEVKEFIERSKNEESKQRRRRRNLWIIVTIVALLIFTGFSWWALNERNKAELESNRANALYFNGLSSHMESSNSHFAQALADYSYHIDSTDQNMFNRNITLNSFFCSLESKFSNVKAYDFSYSTSRFAIYQHDSVKVYNKEASLLSGFKLPFFVKHLKIAPNSNSVIIVSDESEVYEYNLKGRLIRKLDKLYDDAFNIYQIEIGLNGEYLCIYYTRETGVWVEIINRIDLSVYKYSFTNPNGYISEAIKTSPDGKHLLINDFFANQIIILNLSNLTFSELNSPGLVQTLPPIFSNNSQYILIKEYSTNSYLLFNMKLKKIKTIKLDDAKHVYCFGEEFISYSRNDNCIDIVHNNETKQLVLESVQKMFSFNRDYVFATDSKSTIWMFKTRFNSKHIVKCDFLHTSFCHEKNQVFYSTENKGVKVVDLSGNKFDDILTNKNIERLWASKSGQLIVCVDSIFKKENYLHNNGVRVISYNTNEEKILGVKKIRHLNDLIFTNNEKYIVGFFEGRLLVLDLMLNPVCNISTEPNFYGKFVISNNDDYIYLAENNVLYLCNISNGEKLLLNSNLPTIESIACNNNGDIILLSNKELLICNDLGVLKKSIPLPKEMQSNYSQNSIDVSSDKILICTSKGNKSYVYNYNGDLLIAIKNNVNSFNEGEIVNDSTIVLINQRKELIISYKINDKYRNTDLTKSIANLPISIKLDHSLLKLEKLIKSDNIDEKIYATQYLYDNYISNSTKNSKITEQTVAIFENVPVEYFSNKDWENYFNTVVKYFYDENFDDREVKVDLFFQKLCQVGTDYSKILVLGNVLESLNKSYGTEFNECLYKGVILVYNTIDEGYNSESVYDRLIIVFDYILMFNYNFKTTIDSTNYVKRELLKHDKYNRSKSKYEIFHLIYTNNTIQLKQLLETGSISQNKMRHYIDIFYSNYIGSKKVTSYNQIIKDLFEDVDNQQY